MSYVLQKKKKWQIYITNVLQAPDVGPTQKNCGGIKHVIPQPSP